MKICFIMYPWERVVPKQDSSLRIIHECASRGHEVSITHPNKLTIRDSITYAFCKNISNTKIKVDIPSFYNSVEFVEEMTDLKTFDVIFMRDNPPIDTLMLNFLDSIKDDVFIINSVEGLRKANNKIYTASYYHPEHDFIPKTHVSKNIDYLMRVISESDQEKMILKPLDGYGGSGVIVIETAAKHSIKSLLDFYINRDKDVSNYVILQDYVEGAEKGDVRVLMLNGKAIGALRRVPASGDARSNISAGGRVEKYDLTPEDEFLCKSIGEKLVQDGIYYAGLDIIGSKLIEVNVLSPGTITDINKLNNTKIQTKIVKFLEKEVAIRATNVKNIAL